MMDLQSLILTIALYAIPMLFAITLHEAAHGYAAKYFGDYTAYQAGRISLNPLDHIDLFGTILVPVGLLIFTSGQFVFGWAKPVPINFGNLREPKRDMFWVAAAGPGANMLMALAWAAILKGTLLLPETSLSYPVQEMSSGGVLINLGLMVLNLIPVPPLDGSKVLEAILPHSLAYGYGEWRRRMEYQPFLGMLIVLLIIFLLGGAFSTFVYSIASGIAGM